MREVTSLWTLQMLERQYENTTNNLLPTQQLT